MAKLTVECGQPRGIARQAIRQTPRRFGFGDGGSLSDRRSLNRFLQPGEPFRFCARSAESSRMRTSTNTASTWRRNIDEASPFRYECCPGRSARPATLRRGQCGRSWAAVETGLTGRRTSGSRCDDPSLPGPKGKRLSQSKADHRRDPESFWSRRSGWHGCPRSLALAAFGFRRRSDCCRGTTGGLRVYRDARSERLSRISGPHRLRQKRSCRS